MHEIAIGVFLFLAGFYFRGQLVELKFKPAPVKVEKKLTSSRKIIKTNPSTPLDQE